MFVISKNHHRRPSKSTPYAEPHRAQQIRNSRCSIGKMVDPKYLYLWKFMKSTLLIISSISYMFPLLIQLSKGMENKRSLKYNYKQQSFICIKQPIQFLESWRINKKNSRGSYSRSKTHLKDPSLTNRIAKLISSITPMRSTVSHRLALDRSLKYI